MTARYRREIERLDAAYEAAIAAEITPLLCAVETWFDHPMIMIGSGGSFSTASFAAYLHERVAKRLARAATPLEIVSGNLADCGAACFTASGRNRDIGGAFKAAALTEVTPLGALVMADETPLHQLGERYAYSNVVGIASPHFKDGFLAVASLISSAVLLLRAYRKVTGASDDLPATIADLMSSTIRDMALGDIADASEALTGRTSISVLHSNALSPAVVDLESRFVEAALGSLHAADFRNFGHGRHFWLAKRADETGVLALVGSDDSKLANRTLDLLPDTVPQLRLDFVGPNELQALAGLIAGLHISEGAGRSAGVDPGKPGVPEFGRRLYRLGPSPARIGQKEINQRAAIRRKQVRPNIMNGVDASVWTDAYTDALHTVNAAKLAGVVLDYDGTLCDQRNRFEPISPAAAAALERLARAGAVIGVATGRGPSAGKAMRSRLPEEIWPAFIIGYYNGAVITDLSDLTDPLLAETSEDDELLSVLRKDSLFEGRRIRANKRQISITLDTPMMARHAVGVAGRYADECGLDSARITASSHSIDIVLGGHSKTDVVSAVTDRAEGKQSNILRIGDKGVWPGNDAELLDHPLGLTVDEASPHLRHCWGLAPAGIKGLQATLHYLDRLDWSDAGGQLHLSPGEKGGRA